MIVAWYFFLLVDFGFGSLGSCFVVCLVACMAAWERIAGAAGLETGIVAEIAVVGL